MHVEERVTIIRDTFAKMLTDDFIISNLNQYPIIGNSKLYLASPEEAMDEFEEIELKVKESMKFLIRSLDPE